MNDTKDANLADDDQPQKQDWTLKKMPIKGGTVLRAAVLTREDKHNPEWVQVEGQVKV